MTPILKSQPAELETILLLVLITVVGFVLIKLFIIYGIRCPKCGSYTRTERIQSTFTRTTPRTFFRGIRYVYRERYQCKNCKNTWTDYKDRRRKSM